MKFIDCNDYIVLDEADRNYLIQTYRTRPYYCDDRNNGRKSLRWQGSGWYRFLGQGHTYQFGRCSSFSGQNPL